MKPPLDIDGSHGEGGGQILRTALTLAALTGRATRVHSVRARRKNPGLAPQHLTNVLALAEVCHAELHGAAIGSTEIRFGPRSRPRAGNYVLDVALATRGGSAGSVTLIFQTLLLPLAFAEGPSRLAITGGTHVPWSPTFDDVAEVYLPTVARMGVRAACVLEAWGFYPAGNGRIVGEVNAGSPVKSPIKSPIKTQGETPARLAPLRLERRGALRRVRGRAISCRLPEHVADRMAARARANLEAQGLPVEIEPLRVDGVAPGAALCLVAEYEEALAGFSALGERGKPAEQVADEASGALLAHHASGAPVEAHLGDQILLPMALANGESAFRTARVTSHLLTNAHVIRQFIAAEIDIEGKEGEAAIVRVRGVGFGG